MCSFSVKLKHPRFTVFLLLGQSTYCKNNKGSDSLSTPRQSLELQVSESTKKQNQGSTGNARLNSSHQSSGSELTKYHVPSVNTVSHWSLYLFIPSQFESLEVKGMHLHDRINSWGKHQLVAA